VNDALTCLRDQGFAPEPLLAEVGLPAEVTEPISKEQFGRLWWLIARISRDEFFGLASRPMRPGSFALLCHAVLHAHSLEQALRRALRFLAVVLDDPRGELRIHDGEAEIVLNDDGPPRSAFAYRTYWLILLGVACWLIGRRIPLRRLDFACPAPEHRADHRQFFGAPARFDRPRSRLAFDASYLGLPPIRTEKALQAFLRDAPANILVRYRHDQGVAAKLRSRLGAVPPTDWPQFDDLAQELHMSPATLRRRLRADGQSFASIKDELRSVLAQKLLHRNDLSVNDIAIALGYCEPSAFYRAFQKWTGQSPRAFPHPR
jgi:AraC-like DNA-binding protein